MATSGVESVGWPEFDEQVRFFFERQGQILNWAALGDVAYQQARNVVASIQIDPSSVGEDWAVGPSINGWDEARRSYLYRRDWCIENSEVPDVALDLACDHTDRVDPAHLSPRAGRPFLGLLCGKTEAGRTIEATLRAAKVKGPTSEWKTGPVHVAYRYVEDKHWYRHPDSWRAHILAGWQEAATHFEAAIAAAVASRHVLGSSR